MTHTGQLAKKENRKPIKGLRFFSGLVLLAFGELRSLRLLSPCFAGGAKKNGSQQGALLTGRGSSCSSATTRGGPSRPLFDFLTIHRMLKIASQPSNNPPRFGQASPTDSSTGWLAPPFEPLRFIKRKNIGSRWEPIFFGTPSGARTLDTLIKSQVLYQLS